MPLSVSMKSPWGKAPAGSSSVTVLPDVVDRRLQPAPVENLFTFNGAQDGAVTSVVITFKSELQAHRSCLWWDDQIVCPACVAGQTLGQPSGKRLPGLRALVACFHCVCRVAEDVQVSQPPGALPATGQAARIDLEVVATLEV